MYSSFIKYFGIVFFTLSFLYGIYLTLGSILKWKAFINSYKRIDFIRLFGNYGRIFYAILGVCLSIISVLMVLKLFGQGPWANLK
jgi:hypothetical protein